MSKEETPEEKKLREKLEAEVERLVAKKRNYTDDEGLAEIQCRTKKGK